MGTTSARSSSPGPAGPTPDGPDPELLGREQIQLFLAEHPAWRADPDGRTVRRTVTTADFAAAAAAVTAIAVHAQAVDHHPDIDIRWRTLHLALSTHSAGGLTRRDVMLATIIDGVLESGFLGPAA